MNLLIRQIRTLIVKNLLITLVRPWFTTLLRAFVLPIAFIIFISYARNLFVQPSVYGIGHPTPIRSFADALNSVGGGRDKLVFVNNGYVGGDIQRVITQVAEPARATVNVEVLTTEDELRDVCRSSLRGVSTCIAAAVFYSSPQEGPDGIWNYSIRADGALGERINVDQTNNDQEIYILPFQYSIDKAIVSVNTTVEQSAFPAEIFQYPYTSLTRQQRQDQIRQRYMGSIIDILAVAIFIGIVGVTYQLTGLVASERELGMTALIDTMMPNKSPWMSQAVRFIAAHLALDIIYGPAWIITGLILKLGVYMKTSAGITIGLNILTGLALSSFSLFGGAFFRKAQLSGISAVVACLLLGVIAQKVNIAGNAAVVILSLLFPPMNYVLCSIFMARWEKQNLPTNLLKAAPENPWTVPAIVLWVLLIVQIIVYPICAALVERSLYGVTSNTRNTKTLNGQTAIRIDSFTKVYRPNWFYRNVASMLGSRRQIVLAVDDLSFDVIEGQIMVLLGANGSGKSTTLDAIAGLTKISSGHIDLNYNESGGFGLCPQKNVLWDSLTVREHVWIFNRLKSTGRVDEKSQLLHLMEACDLGRKAEFRTKTLSGGQKRKLQLAVMFTGGSSICCVDEVSSGLDPISRRKVWDILLAERGKRTILLTTHFLDEAELLADHIAILSKGALKAQGSSVELKHTLGSGYRIHVYNVPTSEKASLLQLEGVPKETKFDETVFTVHDSLRAAQFVAMLEQTGITEYRVSGPTIEDVFLKVAEELAIRDSEVEETLDEQPKEDDSRLKKPDDAGLELLAGERIGMIRQAWVLFLKRAIILRRNYLPYALALLIPVIAAGLVTLFMKDFNRAGCSPAETYSSSHPQSLTSQKSFEFLAGPPDQITRSTLNTYAESLSGASSLPGGGVSALTRNIHVVDSIQTFNDYLRNNIANVTPGAFYVGDSSAPTTLAWKGNGGIPLSSMALNALNNFVTNISIGTQFQYFDTPWQPDVGKALQLIVYFGLAMAVYPALFALYPTVERLRSVRDLHYSNGVRSLPLWLAYLAFDFCLVFITSILAIVIFRAASDAWYHAGYLFVVFFLYGLCSTLLSYVVSLFSRSQLGAFACAAGGQCVMFLIYFIAYMSVLTYAPTTKIDSYVNIAHFIIAIVTPVGNLARSMFVSLNVFSILCRDRKVASYPGEITLYGGPILYLILQAFFLFGLLLLLESSTGFFQFRDKAKYTDIEERDDVDGDISNELARVSSANNGLRVLHLTKAFGKSVAVQDVTFGVRRGEVFALLGPNGAGKTTTISLIRGDLQPSNQNGEIFVENVSVVKHRATARSHLGVCPQFDAMDQMTVLEHLNFYARIRGVPDVEHNVREVLRAVGLTPYGNQMAAKLSGGNKRKLSLGIALMGNPTVLLLDEPSSGMDAASKRVMWRTLAAVVPGRSLVLTTHSMEEADALATRAGIMAKKMLALGTTEYLRRKYGSRYHVHLVHAAAPHTSNEDMERIHTWVRNTFPGADIERKTYHGQLRFSVPVSFSSSSSSSISLHESKTDITYNSKEQIQTHITRVGSSSSSSSPFPLPMAAKPKGIGTLFSLLEDHKEPLGIAYYSVGQTSLDQVFLSIVGQHNVEEEAGG
ncbi:ABC transporter [Paecilomyces variotii No. 5]|uniref:ABC transporter n=1 Tax=Byssochlamys spectabilis (strain No. 5 / NBRC 109023) TaxID=1356009 RepID=V5FJQ3_BYSSN|nr:ABC transporter [Paecilomyces variotii No. 5]